MPLFLRQTKKTHTRCIFKKKSLFLHSQWFVLRCVTCLKETFLSFTLLVYLDKNILALFIILKQITEMKQYLIYLLAFISIFTFTSCGDDEPSSGDGDLIGTWQEDDEFTDVFNDVFDYDTYHFIQFKKDGTYFEVDVLEEIEVIKGTWTRNGNTIYAKNDAGSSTTTIVSITKETLVTSTFGIQQTYKRVNDNVINKYIRN